jgi:hypothetical protein
MLLLLCIDLYVDVYKRVFFFAVSYCKLNRRDPVVLSNFLYDLAIMQYNPLC